MEINSVPVTLEQVTKVFRDIKTKSDVYAVNEAQLQIAGGELVTLLGPSGCGKTTMLRMIAGFELPTRGKIRIGGEDVTFLPPNARATATVFQSYGLFPHLDVFDNVAYGLRVRKVGPAEIETRVMEALDLVGLKALSKRAPGRLSGGQQQRVALARSLVVRPQVLLLDEPLSNLDALLREQMRVEIRRIQKSLGITAIYVTHSRFVAGFVGKVAFFPVDVPDTHVDGPVPCLLNGKPVLAGSMAPGVGARAVLMARPESLRLGAPGEGACDGTVATNVYLGSSVESFVTTPYGEILVQIDDPSSNRVRPEGSAVSISFDPSRVRLLPAEAAA